MDNAKIEKLLKILNLSEESQKIWLVAAGIMKISEGEKGETILEESLADLAFRLRDKLDSSRYGLRSLELVKSRVDSGEEISFWTWWIFEAQPIHWIIAALIAQELAKDK